MATLGQQLKAAREAKGVSESEAGKATKILTKLIVAMEADDFSDMAAPTYAKGFIRLYAEYLDLDPAPLVEEYLSRHAPGRKPLIDEESQLEKSRRKPKAIEINLDWLPKTIPAADWLKKAAGFFSTLWKKVPVKDVRILAGGAAALVVLVVLISSISTCVRRRAAEAGPPAPPPEPEPARMLLDEPLPDLYLVEPGQIEVN